MLRDLPAPAKLNLFLHVVGRRPDGYHLLETAFTFIDHCDRIDLAFRPPGVIERSTDLPGVPAEDDLCIRAARLLAERSGAAAGVSIAVRKVLPMGGGLGGGSSDAATVLLGLDRLWGLGWSRDALAELGLELGADVPVFVRGHSAFATGIGEQLQPLAVPPAWYLVVTPPVQVPTGPIFAAAELTRNTPRVKIADFSTGFGHNDLEPVVCSRYPAVRDVLMLMRRHGEARMTGSGCCVFAARPSQTAALHLRAQLPESWQCFVVQGLQDHPLKDW
jgi:4-diphosphocytidyl-2-C-methyl-D-erythritol kinase